MPVRHIMLYSTRQRLNRRRKALVPKNKPKEAEFPCMLEGKLYWGAWLLKKSQNMAKSTNNLKFDMNININLVAIILLLSLLLLFFQYPCLFRVLGYLKVAILDVGILKSYIPWLLHWLWRAVIPKVVNKIRRRWQLWNLYHSVLV